MPINTRTKRYDACRVLRAHGIVSVLWFEDAIANYGVPTVLFDLYLLVRDIDEARSVLEQNGWTHTMHRQGYIYNDVVRSPQLRLQSPAAADTCLPVVVVLPAGRWYFDLERYVMDTPELSTASFFPPLPTMLDAFIDGLLDRPLDLGVTLNLYIGYLIRYAPALKDREFTRHMRYDNRQFLLDAIFGMDYSTLQFAADQRRVREELRAGTRQITKCSALTDAIDNPTP